MGWSGDFQIKYKGNMPKEFHKLAKMIIPNSIYRFNFDSCTMHSDSVELSCTRNLSWYSADEDMQKLISYLSDNSSILMIIDGEGDYEEVEINKIDGKVVLKKSNPESERYISSELGISEMLFEELSPRYACNNTDAVDICSPEGYIQLVANTFALDDKLIPVVQNFMYLVLDKDKMNSFAQNEEDKLSDEDCIRLEQLKNKFVSIESTSIFLKEQLNTEISFKSKNKQDVNDLPEWVQKYPKSVISSLGGPALLQQLIVKKGEQEARYVIEMLGGAIMDENAMKDSQTFGSRKK